MAKGCFARISIETIGSMTVSDGDRKEQEGESCSSPVERSCVECEAQTPIYQCPRCLLRTCSLECCNSHKKRTGCSGKRNRAEFVPVSRMTDGTMRNDYFFLEEVLQHIPRNGKRARTNDASKIQTTTSKKARRLLQQAERRGITLQIMPPMMVRHKSNSSWYCGPRDTITWKVEVILHPGKEVFSFNLSENESNIHDHIFKHGKKENVLISPGEHSLLIMRLPSQAKNPLYLELGPSDTLKTILKGLTIVEHPTIHFVPQELRGQFASGSDKISEVSNEDMEATTS